MNYIIELKMTEENISKEGYVDRVKKFLDERINKYNTFEVFNSRDKREYDIRTCQRVNFGDRDNIKLNGATRYCSTLKKNCYPDATITRYDFDDVSKTYFIEVEVPEAFDPNGYFIVRDFSQMNKANPYNKSDNVQIVGLDYILRKGEPEDENQSRTQDKN